MWEVVYWQSLPELVSMLSICVENCFWVVNAVAIEGATVVRLSNLLKMVAVRSTHRVGTNSLAMEYNWS